MKCIHIFCVITLLVIAPSLIMAEPVKKYDVFGVGNSMVDIIVKVSEQELAQLLPPGVKKGGDIHIDEASMQSIMKRMKDITIIPGGSSANVMVNISSFNGKAAFNSVIKDDELGKLFKESMDNARVSYLSPINNQGKATATCLTFITPDGDRTFVVNIGTAADMSERYIDYSQIKDSKVLYTEGSIWDHEGTTRAKAATKAIGVANRMGVKVAFNLHDEFYISQYRSQFLRLLPMIDIVISNENGAKKLFATDDLTQVIQQYQKRNKIGIVTLGAKGAIIITKNEIIHIPALVEKKDVVDTTGAGDAFAAGFLYGYTHGKSLKESGHIGAQAASQIIRQLGARPNRPLAEILTEMSARN